jgi:hypothetical protein
MNAVVMAKVSGPALRQGRPRLVERQCVVCEWRGEVTEHARESVACPWCHAPTELIRVLTPEAEVAVRGGKNVHAAALGRLGGLKGGPARAGALSAARRREIARKAARARWKKKP